MRFLGLICARKESKGIAGKNIRPLAGKPLIAWSIDVAKQCPSLERVVVSTDGENIAEIAQRYGADVPFLRPAELAKDDTLQIHAIRHAVLALEEAGDRYDGIVLLQPTSPLRRVEEVEGCIAMMRDTGADTIISLTTVSDAGPEAFYSRDESGLLAPYRETARRGTLRQKLPTLYSRSGSVYVLSRNTVVEDIALYGTTVRGYVCTPETQFNLDNEFDWELTTAWIAYQETQNG